MINTTLCYLERDSQYLMLHRVKKESDLNHGKWVGVGGKFERDESPDECARREILEETGLTGGSLLYRGVVTFVSDQYETEYMHLFTGTNFTGPLKDCDEGVLQWVEKRDLETLPMWEGDRIFFDLIARDHPFFSLKLCYEGDSLVRAVLDGKTLL